LHTPTKTSRFFPGVPLAYLQKSSADRNPLLQETLSNFCMNAPFIELFSYLRARFTEVTLINPWLLGEKCKPIIIGDADKALHSCFPKALLI